MFTNGHVIRYGYFISAVVHLLMSRSTIFRNNQFITTSKVVKALCYKPAGRGFDSRWCHWNFSVTYFLRSHNDPRVDSASNRNEYQVYFLG